MDMDVIRAIEALPELTVAALRKRYREVFGQETRAGHKQFLMRRIAWQLQAQAQGDLSERARQRATQIADDADLRLGGAQGFWSWPGESGTPAPSPRSAAGRRDGRLPAPGSLLRRRHGERTIVVKVLEDGFEYEGRPYRSLSAIAREATGTRWNGLLFFGLTERRRG